MKADREQKILLLTDHKCEELTSWVQEQKENVILSEEAGTDFQPDIFIVDSRSFSIHRKFIEQRRTAGTYGFVPVLLLAHKGDSLLDKVDLDSLIDEIIYLPSQEKELIPRIEFLLSARKRSLLAFEFSDFTKLSDSQELSSIEEILGLAIDLTQVGIYQVDENSSIIYVNAYACQMTGYSKEELLSMKIYELDPDFDEAGFLRNRKMIRKERSAVFQTRHKKKNGDIIPVEISVTYFEYNGEFLSFSLARDISEQIIWEKKLIESEEELRRIIEATEVGTWSWNLKENKLDINDRWAEMCGFSKEELMPANSETWKAIVHPDDLKNAIAAINDQLEGRSTSYRQEIRMKHKDGHWLWILASGKITLFDAEGTPLKFEGTHLDITDRVEARQLLEKSREMYKHLVEDINDVIYELDYEGKFVYISPTILNLTGISDSDYLGRLFEEVIFPDDRLLAKSVFESHINGHDVGPFEIRLEVKKGPAVWIRSSSRTVIEKGTIIGVRGTAYNISLQKETENLLIEARERAEESDRLKTAFLANISHEIRTPMNGIIGFAHLLSDANINDERKGLFLEQIQKSANRMLNLINDLVDISLIDSEEMILRNDRIMLKDFFEEIKQQHLQSLGLKNVAITFPGLSVYKDLVFYTDRPKLFTIVSNLVKNAIKFTIEGTIELGCHIEGKSLKFFVTDTGTGIDPEIEPFMFERFRKCERVPDSLNQGPGLGLSIAKEFVEQLGGSLSYRSIPGKGTTFYFTIPFSEAK